MRWYISVLVVLASVCWTCQAGGCDWNSWGKWSSCDVTCGTGERYRSRKCPSYCDYCPGKDKQTETCENDPCCGWSSWGKWSSCDVTCGTGERYRSRECPEYCDCPGKKMQTETCDEGPCCAWNSWSKWSSCDVTCGTGERSRSRQCMPDYCPPKACPGDNMQTKKCKNKPCCKAKWTKWGKWSGCDDCDHEEKRKRKCKWKPKKPCKHLGKPKCTGHSEQTRKCDYKPSEWGQWSQWSTCPTCGDGNQMRSRTCKTYCSECKGDSKQTRACPYQRPCCSCYWGEWGRCTQADGYPPKCYKYRTCMCEPEKCGTCNGDDKQSCRCKE